MTDPGILIRTLLLDFVRAHPTLTVLNLVFLFLVPLQDVVLPHYYGKVMDALGQPPMLLQAFIVVVVLMVIIQLLYLVSDFHDAKLFPTLQAFVRARMVNNVLSTYETAHQELETGLLNSQMLKVPTTITHWFERLKNYILPYFLVFLLATAYFTWKDPPLGIALLIVLIVFTISIARAPLLCEKISEKRDASQNQLFEHMDDLFRNLYSVYGANQKEQELAHLHGMSKEFTKLHEDTVLCCLKVQFWLTPLIVAYLIFFMRRSYVRIQAKQLTAPTFIPMFIILLYLVNSMYILNDQLRETIFEWGIIKASSGIFAPPAVTAAMAHPISTLPLQGIGFHDVTFTYPGTDTPILEHFNLHIQPGEHVAFVGNIGSGKSTLIKLLMRYHTPTAGTIYWNGRPIQNIPITELRQRIGYVPQVPILFNRTLLENILYGSRQYSRAHVVQFIRDFGIGDAFEKLLDTKIGKNGSKISGGQRQIVWCMRVFLMNPNILILDEPTASVDEKTKHVLYRMLAAMAQDKTVLLVTHDPSLMKVATRTIEMQQGRIVHDTATTRRPHLLPPQTF